MSGDWATHWIDGRPIPSSGERIEVVNPATGAVIGTVPVGTAEDVDAAVRAAQAAFPAWSATSLVDRAKIVERISEGFSARVERIAQSVTAEMGSPIAFSRAVQAAFPVAVSATFAAIARDFAWEEEIGNSLVIREPIGVVGAITPWNFPLHQIVAKVAPAIVAGNTVVVKPSEVAPLTAEILAEVVVEAGLPAGVLNIVHGTGAQVGEAIARHPGVDMVSFTGSTAAGKRVSVVASDTVKRVALELGGKSASVVLASADIEEAARAGLAGAWLNSGQTCAAWTRMLVPAAHHDRMVEALVAAAAAHPVGNPTDEATVIGPMSSELQRQRVTGYIERGIADGARLALGGPSPVSGLGKGAYVQPTIFADVDSYSVIAQEEIFGPVLSVIPYGSEAEAVEIANNTVYGLSGAVFGDPDQALRIARKLRTGQVSVNDGQFNVLAPFGGYKQSGNGREFGRYGLEEFLETKAVQR
ncbi:aldehyde dehydrogenase family protein [Nocardia sp. NPDC050630]|uniref:aldehyde dehydrogenase family protein n=1 Tax=Nocardia sp. NPDC050630 TaxID=3364321 RepID=UPI0037AB2158